MRSIGIFEDEQEAKKFVAYLFTQGISTKVELSDAETDGQQFEIWVVDEDHLERARDEFEAFLENPRAPKYEEALPQARQILKLQQRADAEAIKNVHQVKMRSSSVTTQGPTPVTVSLVVASIAIFILTNFGEGGPPNSLAGRLVDLLSFVSNSAYKNSGGNPAASLMQGELWRVITPIFLHWGILHLVMNMLMLVSFGRLVERLVGTPLFLMMVVTLAILPNLLQGLAPENLHGSPFFGGMSGVLFGLFGYVWVRSSLDPWLGVRIPFPFIVLLLGLLIGGLLGFFPGLRLAHLCHLGGLIIGLVWGWQSAHSGSRH